MGSRCWLLDAYVYINAVTIFPAILTERLTQTNKCVLNVVKFRCLSSDFDDQNI